jgi:crooked neck
MPKPWYAWNTKANKIKLLHLINSEIQDFEDEGVVYPLSLRYDHTKAMKNVRSKYLIIIVLMIILAVFLVASFMPTRSLPIRIGYFADKVTEDSFSLSGLSEIAVNSKNWAIYLLENTDSRDSVEIYVSAARGTDISFPKSGSVQSINIDSGDTTITWFARIKIPGGVSIPKLSFKYDGDSVEDLLLFDETDGDKWITPMIIVELTNKNPAALQITAEQLLREAQAYQANDFTPTMQPISDPDELEDYKYRQRKEFEDSIRRQTHHLGNWMKYAEWEAAMKEFARSRSIYERALEVDYQNVALWLRYAEMEMKNKFINHARNVWERACKLLPGVDQFWLKYAYMEEVLSNYTKVREIFESWMTWNPKDTAWLAYLKFEERMGSIQNWRNLLERFVYVNPNIGDQEAMDAIGRYMKAAKFEEKVNERERARSYYERALTDLGEAALKEDFFLAFCRFEIKWKEFERARVLFKYALDRIPKGRAVRLYNAFIKFEKQHGTYEEMEDVILNKRRSYYEEEINRDSHNYDIWFDYIRLEESTNNIGKIRDVYERAIENEPPGNEKIFWKRYVFLWINYAIFEEDAANNSERAQQVYETILERIKSKNLSFSKLWIYYAHFYIRQLDIAKARKILGQAIARCPTKKVFIAYIQIENSMGNFDRWRRIYEKWIELFPNESAAWISFAEFEAELQEFERARFIFNLATQRDVDYPENIWRTFIDFEIKKENFIEARKLFRKLLEQSSHLKVWIAFAKFELHNVGSIENCREIYQEAYDYFKKEEPESKEERQMILESWLNVEKEHGTQESFEGVKTKMPKRIKKRRRIKLIYNNQQEGDQNVEEEGGWEEFYDYIFPDDENQMRNLKIIEMAHKWKNQKTE